MTYAVRALRLTAALAALPLAGCVASAGAFGPVGGLYTQTHGPVTATGTGTPIRVGRSTGRVVFGIADGNASIQAAMANGGIGRVHHVDYEATLYLSLFGTYTVVVYGEAGDAEPPPPLPPPRVVVPDPTPDPEAAPEVAPLLDVEAVQRALNGLGFTCGTPDGVAGRRTRECLRAFQQQEGLGVTGMIDQETSDAIRRLTE